MGDKSPKNTRKLKNSKQEKKTPPPARPSSAPAGSKN
jgi:hypothetical protein